MLGRIPIRLRLTLTFALAMAAVLAATGAFLYLRLEATLDESVDQGLEARAAEVEAAVERGESGVRPAEGGLDAQDERLVQVLAPSGAVLAQAPDVGGSVLEQADRARAARGSVRMELDDVPAVDGPVRVLALPAESPDGTRVVVVGASLEDRDETLGGFVAELLLIGPAALLLASLLGYTIATAALRPVEAMRAEAAIVSDAEPNRRLPLPAARDEIRRLGETLNAMLGRLERGLARERSFVADASHELRTPLTLLKTELELALRRPRTEAELETGLRSAAAETDRLAQLAEDLLVLARSDQGHLVLTREPTVARDLLIAVAERFRGRAEAAGRAIEVDAPDSLALPADAVRLEQALGNLVENALRHGRGSIRLVARRREGGVELHVLDEGAGFPPAFLEHAFERFTRGDEARGQGGAGLGLAIAQVIAEAHGGSAHASGRSGGGADVWLSLPRGVPA